MTTTHTDIARWYEAAPKGTAFMLVICDTFDYDDFPVYCASAAECADKLKHYRSEGMFRVMECYDFAMDKTQQLAAHRAYNFPAEA